jgi:hypothetical protein
MVLLFANTVRRSQGRGIERAGTGWRAVLLVAAGIFGSLVLIERLGFILAGSLGVNPALVILYRERVHHDR